MQLESVEYFILIKFKLIILIFTCRKPNKRIQDVHQQRPRRPDGSLLLSQQSSENGPDLPGIRVDVRCTQADLSLDTSFVFVFYLCQLQDR